MTNSTADLFDFARKIQGIAQSGLAFSKDPYDQERYQQLQDLVAAILSAKMGISSKEALGLWHHEEGYATPKVDIRGAVFVDDKILMVLERATGKWTLPGGWADINDSPSDAVVREIKEESGFESKPIKLAAVYDRKDL